jgi:hypothetical protein
MIIETTAAIFSYEMKLLACLLSPLQFINGSSIDKSRISSEWWASQKNCLEIKNSFPRAYLIKHYPSRLMGNGLILT